MNIFWALSLGLSSEIPTLPCHTGVWNQLGHTSLTSVALLPGSASPHLGRSLKGSVAKVSRAATSACAEGKPWVARALLSEIPAWTDSLGSEHCPLPRSPLPRKYDHPTRGTAVESARSVITGRDLLPPLTFIYSIQPRPEYRRKGDFGRTGYGMT